MKKTIFNLVVLFASILSFSSCTKTNEIKPASSIELAHEKLERVMR